MENEVELSVVLPCLNEEEGVGVCIQKINRVFQDENIKGEVVVSDNGSTDASVKISEGLGARVVHEPAKGYGSALRRGINESRGKYIIMGDADDTYDFFVIPKFLALLREGNELVMGSRFKGEILPGAMSWSHRYVGNPILSGMLRLFFKGTVSDSHCGLRGFSRVAYERMDLHTTGMEFASEIVIHALKKKLKIAEVPINLHPRRGEAKIESFRDAWRHARFMLLYSPNYLFLLPGLIIFAPGFLLLLRFLNGDIFFAGRFWGLHLAVFAGIATILGWQILNIGFVAKIYAHMIGLEESKMTRKFLKKFTLERSLILGAGLLVIGLAMLIYIIVVWLRGGFGALAQERMAVVALVLVVMGAQVIFNGFLGSVLQVRFKA